jgi:NagD protein
MARPERPAYTAKGMRERFTVICDVDGVFHLGERPIPGAARFAAELQRSGRKYMLVTNSPDKCARELRAYLKRFGIDVPLAAIHTAAESVAEFVAGQVRRPRVYLLGSPGQKEELAKRGAVFTDKRADFVVVGGGGDYGIEELNKAVELVLKGAKLVAANREKAGPSETGLKLGGAGLTAPITLATGREAYVVGKPNHLMVRAIERKLEFDPARAYMIGDSLDTDIDVGLQAQMKTILVLSGITKKPELDQCPFQPDYVYRRAGDIPLGRLP